MKFGHTFSSIIEATHPSVSDKFLCYKTLKKCLKNIPAPPEGEVAPVKPGQPRRLNDEECVFVKTLNAELKKFNDFFINKEEELVMKESKLEGEFHRLMEVGRGSGGEVSSVGEQRALCHAYAEFHGELVLLEHWVSLNYTALVKILKKHDKRSSLSLRSPFLVSVLQQPFYSTEVLGQLIGKAEDRFKELSARLPSDGKGSGCGRGENATSSGATVVEAKFANRGKGKSAATRDGGTGGGKAGKGTKAGIAADSDANTTVVESTLERTKAALDCWHGLKDSESLLNPYGVPPIVKDPPTGTKRERPNGKASNKGKQSAVAALGNGVEKGTDSGRVSRGSEGKKRRMK